MVPLPYLGIGLLAVLAAYLFFGAPQGTTRSMLITIINVLLFAVVVYFILSLFKVI